MAKKLTIQDVARLAGVSKATVSRVLNQHQNVDPVTRERVMQVVNEQSFVPNLTASRLAGGRTRLLGAFVPSLTWPLIPELMRGIGDVVGETPYELILYSISDVRHEQDHSDVVDRIVGSNLAAGLLAVFPGPTAKHLVELHSEDFPVVLIDDQGQPPPANVPWISVDNRDGAYQVTRHLLQLGHRRIAHIQGPLRYQVSRDRYQGYCDALEEAGITPDPQLVMVGDFMPPSGRVCASAFFELPDRPTAIFAGSDYMAYGAIAAAKHFGLRIPEDVAIAGFDDNKSSAHTEPSLTTVIQPFYEMGRRATTLLLSLLGDSQSSNGHATHELVDGSSTLDAHALRVKMPATLVVRASSSKPQDDGRGQGDGRGRGDGRGQAQPLL